MSVETVVASLGAGATGGILGGLGSLIKDARTAWTNEIPADKRADFDIKMAELENAAMSAQVQINIEEAKSDKLFVSGWRPFVGWVCGVNLLYSAMIYPTMNWIAAYNGAVIKFPILDNSITSTTLVAMLGLGVMRSFDKKQAPTPAGKE